MPVPDPKLFTSAAVVGRENFLRLFEAGACIGCGNDGGTPFVFPGGMAFEMALLRKIGIKPGEILRMATINNARILRRSDELGSIKKGKSADLIVLSANPLEDIHNIRHIEKVIFEGRIKYATPGPLI